MIAKLQEDSAAQKVPVADVQTQTSPAEPADELFAGSSLETGAIQRILDRALIEIAELREEEAESCTKRANSVELCISMQQELCRAEAQSKADKMTFQQELALAATQTQVAERHTESLQAALDASIGSMQRGDGIEKQLELVCDTVTAQSSTKASSHEVMEALRAEALSLLRCQSVEAKAASAEVECNALKRKLVATSQLCSDLESRLVHESLELKHHAMIRGQETSEYLALRSTLANMQKRLSEETVEAEQRASDHRFELQAEFFDETLEAKNQLMIEHSECQVLRGNIAKMEEVHSDYLRRTESLAQEWDAVSSEESRVCETESKAFQESQAECKELKKCIAENAIELADAQLESGVCEAASKALQMSQNECREFHRRINDEKTMVADLVARSENNNSTCEELSIKLQDAQDECKELRGRIVLAEKSTVVADLKEQAKKEHTSCEAESKALQQCHVECRELNCQVASQVEHAERERRLHDAKSEALQKCQAECRELKRRVDLGSHMDRSDAEEESDISNIELRALERYRAECQELQTCVIEERKARKSHLEEQLSLNEVCEAESIALQHSQTECIELQRYLMAAAGHAAHAEKVSDASQTQLVATLPEADDGEIELGVTEEETAATRPMVLAEEAASASRLAMKHTKSIQRSSEPSKTKTLGAASSGDSKKSLEALRSRAEHRTKLFAAEVRLAAGESECKALLERLHFEESRGTVQPEGSEAENHQLAHQVAIVADVEHQTVEARKQVQALEQDVEALTGQCSPPKVPADNQFSNWCFPQALPPIAHALQSKLQNRLQNNIGDTSNVKSGTIHSGAHAGKIRSVAASSNSGHISPVPAPSLGSQQRSASALTPGLLHTSVRIKVPGTADFYIPGTDEAQPGSNTLDTAAYKYINEMEQRLIQKDREILELQSLQSGMHNAKKIKRPLANWSSGGFRISQ
eukprot:gnl/MRDRNA2_/MRDRNA2_79964_c0_seq3.p1 gnl/MRDRNA2_/MRDRNA2_79964_c0~~gnl/MRDRNA2_/MRDRNA2_79964_c0_seq3.p1  ORF type:complete len:990 (+),score=267.16 gnl/MRDRNA2_/MRDRNA2_79964_c0_seq3:147-2972(+)